MVELKNKMYQFIFSKNEERSRVLEKRPWAFDNQMLVILPWKKDIENEEELFSTTQMWVQVWHIPTQWLSSETAWKLGKLFKKCLNVVIPESGSKEGRVVKILVEIELNKPLVRGTFVRFEGDRRWVSFKYEQLPLFCFYCGKVGHGERNCQKKITDA